MAESRDLSAASGGEVNGTSGMTQVEDTTGELDTSTQPNNVREDVASSSRSVVDIPGYLDGDDSENEQIILDPEHPLMVRFQNALGTQLKKRLADLEAEENELKMKMVSSKKERESLGMTLYSEQQDLALAQARLESLNENLQVHTAQRLGREAEMDCLRNLYRNVAKDYDTSRQQANVMQKELDEINLRLFCLMSSQKDLRSDVKVMKRAALKTRMDLSAQEQEKKMQDYRVDLLVELIDQKKTEIEMSEAQTIAQEAETIKFKDMLAEANMELEVLHADVKQIHSNWKSTLLGMQRRDESLADAMMELQDAENLLLSKQKEIEAFRRNTLQSEESHEKLSYAMARVNNDIASSRKAIAKSRKKFDQLKIEYTQKSRILRSVEESCSKASSDKASQENERAMVQKAMEKIVGERNALKEELLNLLQSHAACTKAAAYTKTKTLAVAQQIAKLENDTSVDENYFTSLEQELIAVENNITANRQTVCKVQAEIREKTNICNNYEISFDRNHITIKNKQNTLDECNKLLGTLLERREGSEQSPLENLSMTLVKSLRKENRCMLEDQTIWVEKQHEFLNLVKDKHELAVRIKRRNQKILTLNGKRRKLDVATEKQSKEKHFYEVDMRRLRVQLEKLMPLAHGQEEKKEEIETSSYLLETDFMRELKDLELDMIKMKDRVVDIQNEKESLLNQLVQLESQVSWWQRKIQLGTEIKDAVDPKKNSGADTSTMKCEIHRMTMRYQSLMREQERLIRGMEDSVTRREYVITGFKAKVRRDPQVLTKSKCNRHAHEAKEKIRTFKKEMEQMDEDRRQHHNQMASIGAELDGKKSLLSSAKEEMSSLELALKQSTNTKYKNLVEIVRRQKRSGYYADILNKKYKPLHSSSSKLNAELQKEQQLMERLAVIIDQLKSQFPNAALALERVTCCYGFTFDNIQRDN